MGNLLVLAVWAMFAQGDPGALTPITERNLADPFVLEQDGYYYVFGTTADGQPPKFFRTKTFAPDDLEWFALEVDYGALAPRIAGLWSFAVYCHTDGSWHGYGTLHYGYFKTVVAHFVPAPGQGWTKEWPIMKWRLANVLIGDVDRGHIAYESKPIRGEDGTLYLIYNSGHPDEVLEADIHIKAMRMASPAAIDPDWKPRSLLSPEGLRSEDRNPGGKQIVEGGTIQRVNGKYLLFYSVGDYALSTYKVGMAWSDALMPPPGETYHKCYREDEWENGRTPEVRYFLQSQWPNQPHFLGPWVDGPGIASLVQVDAQDYLIFHGRQPQYRGQPGERRCPWRIPVIVNVSAGVPPRFWIRPLLPRR